MEIKKEADPFETAPFYVILIFDLTASSGFKLTLMKRKQRGVEGTKARVASAMIFQNCNDLNNQVIKTKGYLFQNEECHCLRNTARAGRPSRDI